MPTDHTIEKLEYNVNCLKEEEVSNKCLLEIYYIIITSQLQCKQPLSSLGM